MTTSVKIRKAICNATCWNAEGIECHCICGGVNHGKNHREITNPEEEGQTELTETYPGCLG